MKPLINMQKDNFDPSYRYKMPLYDHPINLKHDQKNALELKI